MTETLRSGQLVLECLPELGGRIISLKFDDQELFFIQPEHAGETFDLAQFKDLVQAKMEMGFRLWGGDKTWISPQSEWLGGIPPLDLDAGPYDYQLTAEGIIMQSAICRETGLQIHREIQMHENKVALTETIINHNPFPVTRSVWNVTQLLRPARVEFEADYSQIKAFETEGHSVSLKESIVKQNGKSVFIDCNQAQHFKYGAAPSSGKVITYCDQGIMFTRIFDLDPDAVYAHGCAVEVFNSADYDYLEVEIHAPLKPLMPGAFTSLHQQWEFTRLGTTI